MTKVDIFSGFLGAGKTTLIKKLVKEAYTGEKIVIIENEFGQIGIDSGFLSEAGIQITEMNSGCICCSLVGDFSEALKKVKDEYSPDRIIIEPSGVGKLSDVISAVKNANIEGLLLNAFTAVIDATKCKMYLKNFAEFYSNQIEYAGAVVLSRTNGITESKLNECVALVRSLNEKAVIITTPWDELDGKAILDACEGKNSLQTDLEKLEHEHHHHHHSHECDDPECHCHEHEHHHHHHGHRHADDVFTSWGIETTAKFSIEEIDECLSEIATGKFGMILRAKGIVRANDGNWIHFDYVPEEKNVRFGSADVCSKICVIGTGLNGSALNHLFIKE